MDGSRRAVVIGVNKYKDETIPALKGAINDAKAIYERLADKDSGGFEIATEHLLLGEQATCAAIREAISDLLWELDHCTLSLLYFSGHGFRDEYGNGYIAPYNINRAKPFGCGIRMQELTEVVQAAKNKEGILLILDCCYSGIATEGKGDMALGAEAPRFDQWFAALKHEDMGRGRIILASSGKNEKSREMLECVHTLGLSDQIPHPHGALTFHLLEGLDVKAATTESDAITLEGLRKYIDEQMAHDHEHQPTFFGAGMQQANQIIIARASRWHKIDEKLGEAEQLLKRGDPEGVFAAVKVLGDVIGNCVKLQKAIELKNRINNKIQQYQNPAIAWLVSRRMDVGPQCSDLFRRLRNLAGGLSFETILCQDVSIQGLLVGLCEVSLRKPGSNEGYISEQTFIAELKAQSTASRQEASVAKPETPGAGQAVSLAWGMCSR